MTELEQDVLRELVRRHARDGRRATACSGLSAGYLAGVLNRGRVPVVVCLTDLAGRRPALVRIVGSGPQRGPGREWVATRAGVAALEAAIA